MSDASTFGGGTAFPDGSVFGASFGGGAAAGPGDSSDAGVAPAPSAPAASGGPTLQQFGQGVAKLLGGPQYTTPDPNASALDQAAARVQERIDRANKISTGVMGAVGQFFDPESVQKARDFVSGQGAKELQDLQQRAAQQKEIQQFSRNYGIQNIPQGADRETATNMMADELQQRYLNGDPIAQLGLAQLGRADLVQAGAEQALSAAASNNGRYRTAIGKLSTMRNPGEYAAAYKELEQQTKDGQHEPHELASVPKTFDEFQKKKQMITDALSVQQLQIESQRARMQQLGGVTPIPKSVDKDGNATGLHAAIASQVRDNNGNPMGGVEPVTVGGSYNGNRLPYGSDNIDAAGDKWGLMTKDEVSDVAKRIEPHKQTLERAAGIDKLNDIASQKDFGTNAWLLGHGIDQFVEISRNGVGGKGSATPGTISVMENIRGELQTASDKSQREWGRVVEWLDKGRKGPQPYMSPETINGLKSAIKTLKAGSDKEVEGTAGGIAHYVGRHGGKMSDIGAETGVSDVLKPYWQQGNTELKQDIASRPAVIRGGQRIVFDREGPRPDEAKAPGGFDQPSPPAPSGGGPTPPGTPMPGGPGGGGPAAPTGGPNPGRYGLTPGMALNTPQALDMLANREIQIESGFKAGQQTGSYKGYGQWSDAEMQRHGITDPNDLGQNKRALIADAQRRVGILQSKGLPATAANVYLMHQQGEAGLEAHLRNPDGVAWQSVRFGYGSDAVAKKAIWGNMTPEMRKQFPRGVDQVKSGDFTRLWDTRVNGTDNGRNIDTAPGAGNSSVANLENRRQGLAASGRTAPRADGTAALPDVGAAPWTGRTTPTDAFGHIATPEERANGPVVNNAPAIGSTLGTIGGSMVSPGIGSIAGGGIGGTAGQAFKDWMQGREQDPKKLIKQGALGAVLGVAGPEAAPLVGAVARVGGAAAVDAGMTAAEGGDTSDIIGSAAEGGAYALGGEVLGRFVSSAGAQAFKALSRYTQPAQKELSAWAGKLSEARETLKTEKPDLPGEAGPNPKYEAAKKAADEATAAIKDHGQVPDDMVHAYEQAKAGVSAGEAATMRGAASEKPKVSAGYNDLRAQAKDAGVGAPKEQPPLPDGPVSRVNSETNLGGKVPAQYLGDAQHAENLARQGAKDFGEKWGQLQNAGTYLINKRTDFALAGDSTGVKAMDTLFEGIRKQQEKVAEYVFGRERGKQIIANLESLDQRYAKVMNATAGMKYEKMQSILAKGNTDEARELEKNFRAFNKGDPGAIRAFQAMKAGAKGDWKAEAALMAPVIMEGTLTATQGFEGAHKVLAPIAALVGGHKLYELARGFMNAKLLGKAVMFRDFLNQEVKTGAAAMIGSAAQRAGVQRSADQRLYVSPAGPAGVAPPISQ